MELGSIWVEHERFQAEMKETVRVLEKNQELTPAVLEHRLTESIGKLMTQVDNVEKSVMTMLSSVTAVSEQHLKLSSQ